MKRRTPEEVEDLLIETHKINETQAMASGRQDFHAVNDYLEENFSLSSTKVVEYSYEATSLPEALSDLTPDPKDLPPGTITPEQIARGAFCTGFHHGLTYALLYLNQAPWGAEPATEELTDAE